MSIFIVADSGSVGCFWHFVLARRTIFTMKIHFEGEGNISYFKGQLNEIISKDILPYVLPMNKMSILFSGMTD